MDERWLQVCDYQGDGFKPLIAFGDWRVAILRSRQDTRAEGITSMERHLETDEVFVLTAGKAVLLIGGDGPAVDDIHPAPMQTGAVYDVRRGSWHAILLSRNASVLIVENQDTGAENSQFLELTAAQRARILEIERRSDLAPT